MLTRTAANNNVLPARCARMLRGRRSAWRTLRSTSTCCFGDVVWSRCDTVKPSRSMSAVDTWLPLPIRARSTNLLERHNVDQVDRFGCRFRSILLRGRKTWYNMGSKRVRLANRFKADRTKRSTKAGLAHPFATLNEIEYPLGYLGRPARTLAVVTASGRIGSFDPPYREDD